MEIFKKIILSPFSLLYGLAVSLRNLLFDLGILTSEEFNLPVICVGNLTAGGTGKTPHVEYLAEMLKDYFQVAVLSRGYKRKTKGFLLADENPDPSRLGDEACQVKKKYPDILVAVDEKRARGIRRLMEMNPSPEVILLDDAFQHRYVKAGLNILLMDYNRPYHKDMLLPSGRMREPVASKKRAQFILVTKSPPELKPIEMRLIARDMKLDEFQYLYFTMMRNENPGPVFEDTALLPGEFPDHGPNILLVSGIANPERFRSLARNYSENIHECIFRDHHDYQARDISRIKSAFDRIEGDKIILTTEKDAVKLRTFGQELERLKDKMFYLPIRVSFLNNDGDIFKNQILTYVRDNKRDSILHKEKSKL